MASVTNPFPAGEQLHIDFDTVNNAQNHAARLDAAASLLARSACLGDALTFYQGVDPVHEVDAALFESASLEECFGEYHKRTVIGLHAAELLIASLVHPGLYERRDSRRVRELSKNADWYKIFSSRSRNSISPFEIIGESLDVIHQQHPASNESLESLGMSAEMLSHSLIWWQISHINFQRFNLEGYKKDTLVRNIYYDLEDKIASTCLAVQDLITEKALGDEWSLHSPEDILRRAALGLKSQARSTSLWLHPYFRYATPQLSIDKLGEMLSTVKTVFLDHDLLDTNTYPKKEVKGLLHEVLWQIDAHMLMLANPGQLQTIHLNPSAGRLDRPVIGRPSLIRGIDFAISDVDKTGQTTQLINLKSGNGDERTYHPRIKVIKEENFADLQRGRLVNKLSAYKKIIDSGFALPETQNLLKKFALPSIQDELSLYARHDVAPDWPFLK